MMCPSGRGTRANEYTFLINEPNAGYPTNFFRTSKYNALDFIRECIPLSSLRRRSFPSIQRRNTELCFFTRLSPLASMDAVTGGGGRGGRRE